LPFLAICANEPEGAEIQTNPSEPNEPERRLPNEPERRLPNEPERGGQTNPSVVRSERFCSVAARRIGEMCHER